MSKSFMLISRTNDNDVHGSQDADLYMAPYGSIEQDNAATTDGVIAVACTMRNLAIFVNQNNLTTASTVTLLNDTTKTSVVVTIPTDSTQGWIDSGANSASFSAGDKFKFIVEGGGGGSGTFGMTMLGLEIEPTTSTDTVSVWGCNSNSATAHTTAGSAYFKVSGSRGLQTTEANVEIECPIAGTLSHFVTTTGTVGRTTNSTADIMIANVVGSHSITITPTDDQAFLQDTGTDTVLADDKLTYRVTNGTGSGACNIEKMGINLINTSDQFSTILGDDYRQDQTDGLTRYYAVGGELNAGMSTETDASYPVPFDMTVTDLVCRVVTEQMTDTSTVTLMKNGSATTMDFDISGTGGAGYYRETASGPISFTAGDTISFRCVTGASGTRLRFGYFGIVAEEDAGGTTITGSGTPQAQAASSAGVAEREITGSGTPTSQASTSSGTGTVGALVTGSGTPAAQSATASGTAERILTGSGTPQAQSSSSSGTALRIVTGSGTPASQSSISAGSGSVGGAISGSGTPQSQSASSSGTAEREITGSGTPTAQASTSAGTALRVITGSGTPQAQSSTSSGSGTVGNVVGGSGTPQAQSATSSGVALRIVTGSGTPQSQSATSSGTAATTGSISGTGTPQAQSATTAGTALRVITGSGSCTSQAATVYGVEIYQISPNVVGVGFEDRTTNVLFDDRTIEAGGR